MAEANKCRMCGKTLTKKTDRVAIDKVDEKEFADWASYVFNVQEELKKTGFPLISCKPCLETAKSLHSFAANCSKLNETNLPKQDWWANLKF